MSLGMEEKNNPIIGFIPEYLTIFVEHIEKHESIVCVFWTESINQWKGAYCLAWWYSIWHYGQEIGW